MSYGINFDSEEDVDSEMVMYRISDIVAKFIRENGYNAYLLSENNQIATKNFEGTKSTGLLLLIGIQILL